ncbi:ABC transporter permease [Millisia brevis]|uniref:ABC transporter permease n=1 Tax=Millisia brevis TaxID=264148 RepID=UPI00083716D5|nr:ABC transporter permease [Millisia brevis]
MAITPTVDLTPARHAGDHRQGSRVRRIAGMAKANALLLTRNRMTLAYAFIFPLIPLAWLLVGDRGDTTFGIMSMTNVLLLAALFPVYYNMLSQTVTRRDELVLKRFRSGESSDNDLLASIAIPGIAVMLIVSLLAVAIAPAFGQPLPANPIVLLVAVLVIATAFAGLAFWTAAWTRNAEAARVTSLPILMLAIVGSLRAVFPESVHPYLELTPGAAIEALVRIAWFGQDLDGISLTFAQTFTEAGRPLAVLVGWLVLAAVLTKRSMRWEPRG